MCALPLLGSSGTAARIHIFVWPCTARGSRLSCKTPPLITGDKSEYEPRAQSACAYKARICYGKVVMRPAAVASAHGIAAPLRFRDQPAGSDVRHGTAHSIVVPTMTPVVQPCSQAAFQRLSVLAGHFDDGEGPAAMSWQHAAQPRDLSQTPCCTWG